MISLIHNPAGRKEWSIAAVNGKELTFSKKDDMSLMWQSAFLKLNETLLEELSSGKAEFEDISREELEARIDWWKKYTSPIKGNDFDMWYQMAENGDPQYQQLVARLYLDGGRVWSNLSLGYEWMKVAAMNGDRTAKAVVKDCNSPFICYGNNTAMKCHSEDSLEILEYSSFYPGISVPICYCRKFEESVLILLQGISTQEYKQAQKEICNAEGNVSAEELDAANIVIDDTPGNTEDANLDILVARHEPGVIIIFSR